MNYVIIIVGWVLGQMILKVVNAIRIQRSSKYHTGFKEALIIFVKKDPGPTVLAVIILLAVMFLLPEAIAHSQSEGDENDVVHNKTIAHVLKWLRLYSIGFGIISEFIGFIAVSKSQRFLRKVAGDEDYDYAKKDLGI
jgi:hypothetical protein